MTGSNPTSCYPPSTARPLRPQLRNSLPFALAAGLLLLWAMPTPAPAADWQGRAELRDGVRYVLNPAVPLNGTREIALRELWTLGDPQDEEAELFGVVISIFEDDADNIYLLDSQLSEVRVYDPQGRALRTIGRLGEGPGEFQNAGDACLLADGRVAVAQTFPGKLVLFNADGTPAGDVMLRLSDESTAQSFTVLTEVRPVGEQLGVTCINQIFGQQGMTQEFILGLSDLSGKLQSRIVESALQIDLSQGYPFIEGETTRFTRRWAALPDGTFYTPVEFHGYAIHVFNAAGELQMVIEREYESVRRTAEERQRVEEMFAGFARAAPNPRVIVEDVHSDIESITARPDGRIWVLTSAGCWRAPEGVLRIYDVFDAEGRFAEQVTLRGPGDPREDNVVVLRDRVVVVGNFMGAVSAAIGGGEESSAAAADEDEGVTVTCYGM